MERIWKASQVINNWRAKPIRAQIIVHATEVEGDVRILSNKLDVYLDGAWEVVTSA